MIDYTEESYLRGHKIRYDMKTKEWVYWDTEKPTDETYNERPCGNCGKKPTKEGHDACIGTLKGVINACCGHGKETGAYVQFSDGFSVRGDKVKLIIKLLRKIN